MKKLIQIILLILVSLMVFSCFDFDKNDFEYDVTVSFPPIFDSRCIKENIPIYAETDTLFSIFNNEIKYKVVVKDSSIIVEFLEIYLPYNYALDAFGPATSCIELMLDGEYDTYDVTIYSGDMINKAMITYADSMYIITSVSEQNVTFLVDTLDMTE